MKTYSNLLTFIAAMLLIFSSCRKCSVCEIKDSNGNVVVAEEKVCGSSTDRSKAKTDAKIRAELIGGTYTCKEE